MKLLKASLCVVLIFLAAFQGYGLRSGDAYSSSGVLLVSTHAVDGEVVISPNHTEGQVGDLIEWHVGLDILSVLLFATHVKIVVDIDQANGRNPWGDSSVRESPMVARDFMGWNWAPYEPTNTSGLFPFVVEIYYEIDPDIFMEIWHGNGTIRLTRTIVVPDDYQHIQEAINAANDGDTVFVRNGIYYENVAVNKTVSLVGEDKQNTIIDGNCSGAVVCIEAADSVNLTGFTIRNAGYGSGLPDPVPSAVFVYNSTGTTLSNSIVIGDNSVDIGSCGINVYGSNDSILTDNMVIGHDWVDLGICIQWSNSCVVSGNEVSGGWAILVKGSYNSQVTDNVVFAKGNFGIRLGWSHSNLIAYNTILNATTGLPHGAGWGLWSSYDSTDNMIHHNNFLNNSNQAYSHNLTNSWDNGCEGNFWSDYDGTDLDGDGVGDTPYVIDANNTDRYPLMNPYWSLGDIDHDLDVDIFDVVKTAAAYGSVPSDPRWNPHCDIAEPYGVINIFDIVTIAMSYGKEYTP